MQLVNLLVGHQGDKTWYSNGKLEVLDYSWAVDSLIRLWELFCRQKIPKSLERLALCSSAQLLSATRGTLSRVVGVKHEIALTSKTALFLCQLIGLSLVLGRKSPEPSLETQICWAIFDLLQQCQRSDVVLEAVTDSLLPMASETIQERNRFQSLGVELQVCTHDINLRILAEFFKAFAVTNFVS